MDSKQLNKNSKYVQFQMKLEEEKQKHAAIKIKCEIKLLNKYKLINQC